MPEAPAEHVVQRVAARRQPRRRRLSVLHLEVDGGGLSADDVDEDLGVEVGAEIVREEGVDAHVLGHAPTLALALENLIGNALDAFALSAIRALLDGRELNGRKVRVTKVPFATHAKALINDDPRGFVKIISDPAPGVILGGSIVGRHAAELISVLAVAVTNGLTVTDIHESMLVHPTLAEALTEAAE